MKEPQWVHRETVLGLHDLSLSQHGGATGLRDAGLFDSALGRPQHLFAYGHPNIFDLAACYAYGLVKNHPFVDGNKRTGFIVAVLMLDINGHEFTATEADAALRTLALAAGDMTESAYAAWLETNSRPPPRTPKRQ